MSEPSDGPVVVVSRSVNDVWWYKDLWSAERNHPALSVSRMGTRVHVTYLQDVPEKWLNAANDIYRLLNADEDNTDKISSYATHMHSVVPNGPLVPVGSHG